MASQTITGIPTLRTNFTSKYYVADFCDTTKQKASLASRKQSSTRGKTNHGSVNDEQWQKPLSKGQIYTSSNRSTKRALFSSTRNFSRVIVRQSLVEQTAAST
ncbi:hypothetical protein Leryth_010724 [Lithospermum erythrorhizon]|nr:hypothetical protein Leryth_010724 [Lithospermum erythrorhizon]